MTCLSTPMLDVGSTWVSNSNIEKLQETRDKPAWWNPFRVHGFRPLQPSCQTARTH
jgi:hypothetical protein